MFDIIRAREVALELLSPTRCAGCERPGELICASCLAALVLIDPRHACLHCGAPHGDVLCTECDAELEARGHTPRWEAPSNGMTRTRAGAPSLSALPRPAAEAHGRVLAMAVFDGPLPRIIRAYKDGGERRLAPLLAELLFDTARHAEETAPERYGGMLGASDAVVFVPATAAAFARRGFDHMEAIARPFAELTGIPLVDALLKHGAADQRALGRAGRSARAHGAYQVVEPVRGKRVLLLDDVITTGATIRAAAAALLDAGALRVDVLALARVW